MFDLFGGNQLVFFVAEDEVVSMIERINRFNISHFEILSRVTENGLWRFRIESHPAVLKALKVNLSGDVVFEQKKA